MQKAEGVTRRSLLAGAGVAGGVGLLAGGVPRPAWAGRDVECGAFADPFVRLDRERWLVSDGWSNGGMFDVGWTRENVRLGPVGMELLLTGEGRSGRRFGGAEVQSRTFAHYGRYRVRMQAARGSGIVSSFFTYTGPPHGDPMDEIDIEILGRETRKLHLNYFIDGRGGNEKLVDLGFDTADGMHDYGFDWHPDGIVWVVDETPVHAVRGEPARLPSHPGKIIMSLWAGRGVEDWLGPPPVLQAPLVARYGRVTFTPLAGLSPACVGPPG